MKRSLSYLLFTLFTAYTAQAQTGDDALLHDDFHPAKNATGSEFNLTLDIETDCWPEETTWELADEAGNVVHEGGPYYGQALTDISEGFWLESGSYTFSFYDAAGDGLFATQWGSLCDENGSFQLVDAGGNVLLEDTGGMDFDTLLVNFEFNSSVSIEENTVLDKLSIFPNPVSDVLNVSVGIKTGNRVGIELMGINGQVVRRESHGFLPAGDHVMAIPVSNLSVGIYTLRIFSGHDVVSRRFIKTH